MENLLEKKILILKYIGLLLKRNLKKKKIQNLKSQSKILVKMLSIKLSGLLNKDS
jgi:hypothetical protein